MLARMWKNGNRLALLVVMQTGAATLENSVEVPQKFKNILTLWSSSSTARNLPKFTRVLMHRGTCTPMFIAALSTIAKLWKEPECPSTDERIKKLWSRGAWVAQSVKRPTSARSRSRGPWVPAPRQALGWWLGACFRFCVSLSLCPSSALSLSK